MGIYRYSETGIRILMENFYPIDPQASQQFVAKRLASIALFMKSMRDLNDDPEGEQVVLGGSFELVVPTEEGNVVIGALERDPRGVNVVYYGPRA